jgi:hypothetical protein
MALRHLRGASHGCARSVPDELSETSQIVAVGDKHFAHPMSYSIPAGRQLRDHAGGGGARPDKSIDSSKVERAKWLAVVIKHASRPPRNNQPLCGQRTCKMRREGIGIHVVKLTAPAHADGRDDRDKSAKIQVAQEM